jgi:hypothetical protein
MVVEGKLFWGFAKTQIGGTTSQLTVLGEKKNGRYIIYSPEEVRKIFTPNGKVFVTKAISSYHAFQAALNTKKKKEYDDDYIAIENSLKPMKYYNLIEEYVSVGDYLSIEKLAKMSDSRQNLENGTYYISTAKTRELIGPFEKSQRGMLPKIGKEANVYDASPGLIELARKEDNENIIFFNSPDVCFETRGEIDCMSDRQLQEWFGTKLREVKGLSSERENALNIVARMLKEKSFSSADDLDTSRFKRMGSSLDQYMWSYDQLKDLLVNDGFEKISRKIEEMRQEIKSEYESEFQKELESLEIEKQNLENEKNSIIADIEKLNTGKNNISTEITDAEKLLESLKANYESILVQLKVASQISGYSTVDNSSSLVKPFCYEISRSGKSFTELKANDDSYQGLELYFRIMEKNLTRAGYDEKIFNVFKDNENSLLKSQAVFIPCVSWAYIFAQSVGNAKLYVMHIEHDWLHYKNFCDNGLVSIWNETADKQDTNFVLVFEDLNITQPECGLTPLLDVINGHRPFLEGTESGLLRNLKIFATIIPPDKENIGLKLSERLFHKWGRFGNFMDINFMYPVENKDFVPFGYFGPEDLAALYDNVYHSGGLYFE